MDAIDGAFAQDIEEFYISKYLDYKTNRINIFQGKDKIEVNEYLSNRGFIK